MDNLKLFNGMIGRTLTEVNTEEEGAEEIAKVMEMTIDEALQYLKSMTEEWPPALRKLKLSTLMDIALNLTDEDTLAELEKLCGE